MSQQEVSLFFQVQGYYVGLKAYVNALNVPEGSLGYATDTDKFGSSNGSVWTWLSANSMAAQILAAASENIADADFFGFVDTSDGNALKKISLANFRTQYLNSHYIKLDQTSNWPQQGSDPSAPAAGFTKVYVKSGGLYIRTSSGIVGPFNIGDLLAANNLSELTSAPTARTNLGLGGAAVLAVGTGAGDVAAGNRGVTNGDSHDHVGGDGAQIDYNNLANLPTLPVAGTYMPTGTAVTNVSSITPNTCHYLRVGSEVMIHGSVSITATAIGAFTIRLTLPIASNFNANTDANGNGTQPGTGVPNVFSVRENQANKELQLDGYAQVNTSVFYRFVAGYIIK